MLSVDTHVVTADVQQLAKRVGDIEVGDHLLGEDGKPVRVTKVSPEMVVSGVEVTFKNSGILQVSSNHVFKMLNEETLRRPEVSKSDTHLMTFRDHQITASELVSDYRGLYRRYGYAVPVAPPVEFLRSNDDEELSVDPYVVGAYYSRGTRPGMLEYRSWNYSYLCELLGMDDITNKVIEPLFNQHGNVKSKNELSIPLPYVKGTYAERSRLLEGICDNRASQGSGRQIGVSTVNPSLSSSINLLLSFQGQRSSIVSSDSYGKSDRVIWTAQYNPYKTRQVVMPSGKYTRAQQYRSVIRATEMTENIRVRRIEVNGAGFLAARNLIPVNGE